MCRLDHADFDQLFEQLQVFVAAPEKSSSLLWLPINGDLHPRQASPEGRPGESIAVGPSHDFAPILLSDYNRRADQLLGARIAINVDVLILA